uniref:Uncharacterized protein MANES_06G149300 n=2 Tax=Rhizophora mucronata TaxID=61149 RepID=A0A2P2KIU9_RHIMU
MEPYRHLLHDIIMWNDQDMEMTRWDVKISKPHQLTPLRSDGRGGKSLLVTMCPLFNPTKRPELGCFGAITSRQSQKQKM